MQKAWTYQTGLGEITLAENGEALTALLFGGRLPQGAAREVGMANHRNPIGIIIPCHRVIGKDGALTGYAGGLGIKERLLILEGALPQRLTV